LLRHYRADDHTLYAFTPAAFAMAADKPDAARPADHESPERSPLLPPKPDALLNPKSLDHLVPAKRESSMLHPRHVVSAIPALQCRWLSCAASIPYRLGLTSLHLRSPLRKALSSQDLARLADIPDKSLNLRFASDAQALVRHDTMDSMRRNGIDDAIMSE
jgi:hypothetical protein